MSRRRICMVATVPYALKYFMRPHIVALSRDYDITLVTSGDRGEMNRVLGVGVNFIQIPFVRRISILHDLCAFINLYRLLRKESFAVIHSITPKAGLLAMAAGLFAGVPVRLHIYTGQVWVTQSGAFRRLLKAMDMLIGRFATAVLADSISQKEFLVREGIVNAGKISVLAHGSVSGVDLNRFKPDTSARAACRAELKISRDAVVVVFLGRLNPQKGVEEMIRAFFLVAARIPQSYLLLVGPDERGYGAKMDTLAEPLGLRYHRIGASECPEYYFAGADILCLPSHREGFGSVIIEAAAMAIPCVASKIYGITDAVVDGETGILHEVSNIGEISDALIRLMEDRELYTRMKLAAQERVRNCFSSEILVDALCAYYRIMVTGPTKELERP